MKRILCWLFGHKWHWGFWQTTCTQCNRSDGLRGWELGYGYGPPSDIEVRPVPGKTLRVYPPCRRWEALPAPYNAKFAHVPFKRG